MVLGFQTYHTPKMRLFLMIPLLVVATMIILLPQANALTARENFDDNHYTYISLGGPKICGDHLCKPGEWNMWIHQLMDHQLNNVKNAIVYTPYANPIKKTAYGDANTLTKTSDGHISQSVTEYMGNEQYVSFVSVSNDAVLKINHIALSQQMSSVHIIKAWIGPNWQTSKTLSGAVFDSSGASIDQGQAVNIVIITDGVPSFTIDSLAGR